MKRPRQIEGWGLGELIGESSFHPPEAVAMAEPWICSIARQVQRLTRSVAGLPASERDEYLDMLWTALQRGRVAFRKLRALQDASEADNTRVQQKLMREAEAVIDHLLRIETSIGRRTSPCRADWAGFEDEDSS